MAANLDKSENSLTSVSTLTYLRGIDASGNSVKISTSDLASVLGALCEPQSEPAILDNNDDLNDIIAVGHYQIANAHKPANCPSWLGMNSYMIVRRFWYGSRVLQVIYDANEGSCGMRFGSSQHEFGSWKRLDNYGTTSTSELANALGVYPKTVILQKDAPAVRIGNKNGGYSFLILNECYFTGIGFAGRVRYNGEMESLINTENAVTFGESSSGDVVLYYDSNTYLNIKYQGNYGGNLNFSYFLLE